ncbi:MAG: hypothetical protein PHC70_04450 [Patescibacteria group bacterium]|nr:hypothetical protein [Patescibacteria group bacterium]
MRLFVCALITGLFLTMSSVQAAMTSTNFEVRSDSINSGGNDNSTSTNYRLRDTIGEQATGLSTSTNYTLSAGYRQSDDYQPTLSLSVSAQENNTQVPYLALSTSTKTVTVSLATSFSTGTYIAVVENLGLHQKTIIGKIESILGNTLTVDKWDGQVSQISINPLGDDDYVYRMEAQNGVFGRLEPNVSKTTVSRTDVTTNSLSGYTVYMQSDGYLRGSTSTHIMDVSDDEVSPDAEEYGARVFGTTATSTGRDFNVTSTLREIQTSTTTADNDRIAIIYKINIMPFTPAANYHQKVRYLLTANF